MGTCKSGKVWNLNRYADPTYYDLGAKSCISAEPRIEPTQFTEVGTGTRKALLQKVTKALPKVTFEIPLSSLEYILAYCVGGEATPQGDLVEHILRAFDGIESHEWTGCMVNTCRVNTPESGTIKATIEVLAKVWSNAGDFSAVSWDTSTVEPMTKTNVTELNVGGVDVKAYFLDSMLNVNNNVKQLVLGTTITPADVLDGVARYNGQIRIAKSAASKFATIYGGTKTDVVYKLTDNAAVAKTLTFKDALLGVGRIGIRGLEPTIETITWNSNELVVT